MTTKSNLKKNSDPLVGEFLESQVPEEMLFVYRIVGNLRYPIIDPAALDGQINERQDSKEAEAVTNFLNNALLEQDFPLQEARGTLEILIDRVQEIIPWTSPLFVPIGLDFSGPGVCQQAVLPAYEYCINTVNDATPELQMLKRLRCQGGALRAVIQCNEKIRALGRHAIRARLNPCASRALRRYAECIVHQLWNGQDTNACMGTYKYELKRCGLRYMYR